MSKATRTEKEIFEELESLCSSPGYVHAIAYFCFRDNTIKYADQMSVEDALKQFSMERFVRTEISTIIGLACKSKLDIKHPGPEKLQEHIDQTDLLLQEIHTAMMPPPEMFDKDKLDDPDFNPFRNGKFLRESIFYGGESAYDFQYRDLSLVKYKNDNDWFLEKKGYSIEQAGLLLTVLRQLQNDKINNFIPSLATKHPSEWTVLPSFIFSIEELSKKSSIDIETVNCFVISFVAPEEIDNSGFQELGDFNLLNAYPIIRLNEKEFLLFQNYGLVEAFYETPFFWFNEDDNYKVKAGENRGAFTESFCEERLKLVFGERRIFKNINIYNGKNKVGEIDVLAIFANRAIVIQAKSKKLTIAARKGNDSCLKQDFKKAVQDAYEQAYSCSGLLNDKNCKLVDSAGNEVTISREFREIYPFCVISDHYPALSFQARQFLTYQTTKEIRPPFIMDVFFLDTLTEMLQSPLHFLSYINRRVEYSDRIFSCHELTILSYHLKQNLWVKNDVSMIYLGDDICADLDLAMLTRRNNVPGIDTPEGILTKHKDTVFSQLINQIDHLDDPATIDLGFILLSLSGDTIEQVNNGIEHLCKLHREDGCHHDLTLGINEGKTGLTIHCNNDNQNVSWPRLQTHCHKRKYSIKANKWFGLCIDPISKNIRFGLELDFDWEQSNQMDELTKHLPVLQNLKGGRKINLTTKRKLGRKIGRNEPCPCGSGKKYKKCCIR